MADRDDLGRAQPGNRLAVSHALNTVELPLELQHLRAEVAAFERACLVDEGDEGDVPARRRALLAYRARVHRRVLQLDESIELRGLEDRKGRLRVSWLSKLESLINTAVRLDNLLGLERKARRVPSLQEVIARSRE